jgi:hypothetical protein
MRRRPGIQGLQRGQQAKVSVASSPRPSAVKPLCLGLRAGLSTVEFVQAQFRAVGDHASEVRLEQVRAQMASFKESLQEFAMKHRSAAC